MALYAVKMNIQTESTILIEADSVDDAKQAAIDEDYGKIKARNDENKLKEVTSTSTISWEAAPG